MKARKTMKEKWISALLTFPIVAYAQNNCAEWSGATCGWEPNLKPMTVDLGLPEKETFYAYVTPPVGTFYNSTSNVKAHSNNEFVGMYGKFINLSPETIHVSYVDHRNSPIYISSVLPFDSSGTATYIGHAFIVTTDAQAQEKPLVKWTMELGNSLYYYDPYDFDIKKAHKALTAQQYSLYHMQLVNKVFAEQYKEFTGTDWLGLYKQKMPPRWHMWRADSIGQTHQVTTKEIHYHKIPDDDELKRGTSSYGPRPDERQRHRRWRHRDAELNLTLKVLSCAPRVLEIENFLSNIEVEHIMNIAKQKQLKRSTVSAGRETANSETRTSTQSWIPRHEDLVIDAIYSRAAHALGMDESLLRWRRATEVPEFNESHVSVAERLQLVHYTKGQQYTAHHDFVMPGLVNLQPSRFATILFYLNEPEAGGETSFPRWLHRESDGPGALKVTPKVGKAVLFYNLLPDGNYDERSHHAAMPVKSGEKWLTNLWVWDPIMDHTKDGALFDPEK